MLHKKNIDQVYPICPFHHKRNIDTDKYQYKGEFENVNEITHKN